MLSKRCPRHHSFIQAPKFTDRLKQSESGTLSSDTTTTSTSSGYSTGGSSLSTTVSPSSKKAPTHQHKSKSKGFHHFLTKLKTFIIPSKTKPINSSPPKDMPPTSIVLEPSLSSNPVSLPFTYYTNSAKQVDHHNECYVTRATNFEKISAWLDRTDIVTHADDDLLFIDDVPPESTSATPVQNDQLMMMKKLSSNSKAPKRSTSLVATLTRPIIERRQYEKPTSPTLSFSSSIMARGMSERLTPQTNHHQSRTNLAEEQTKTNLTSKSNRRRAIDFTRRRTVGGAADQINQNKENLPSHHPQQVYRFSPTTSTNVVTKKYYFHPATTAKNEDILMNSYGLTILQQRQSTAPVVRKTSISQTTSLRTPPQTLNQRPSIRLPQRDYISDSLDDILCDREVESYFYPNRQQPPLSIPQHVYINLGSSSDYYQPPSYIHSTLC